MRFGSSVTVSVEASGVPARLVLTLPSDVGVIEHTVDEAVTCCAPARIEERRLLFNLRVGLTEAIANAMLHGNGSDPGRKVTVDLVVAPGEVRATVQDEGRGFDPSRLPDPRLPENRIRCDGRGVFMMRRLMDEVRFSARGNRVTMVLRSGAEGGQRAPGAPPATGIGFAPRLLAAPQAARGLVRAADLAT